MNKLTNELIDELIAGARWIIRVKELDRLLNRLVVLSH